MTKNVKLTKANVFSSGSIIAPQTLPAFFGDGAQQPRVNYICAGCDGIVGENVLSGVASNICVRCPLCGTTSAFPKVL